MRVLLVAVLLLVCTPFFAQNKSEEDLKVGLVLSGGGAKGLAHIGVLKVIDSLGIRVDYVAGTSMGAIVGALYASGYSGKAIDSIFKSVDFDNIIIDNIPRRSKTYYERENSERYALTLPFDNFKVRIPTALTRGQNTFNLLSELTLHVNDVADFKNLPIPFFCMATDMETGKAVVLERGNLAQSIMASGALPTLFQPMHIGDHVYIDGGVVNNYPLDEMKAKGVDVVIGVDVQDELAKPKDLKSATEILYQIHNYSAIEDMKKKVQKTDVYIKPNIEDFTVISFDYGDEIIKNGEAAAKRKLPSLEEIVSRQSGNRPPFPSIKQVDSLNIKRITIYGNEHYTRAYILGKLKLKSDSKVSYVDFSSGVNNLIATNNFDSFIYELTPDSDGVSYNLVTHVIETSKRTALKFALHYDELYKSAALINLTRKRLMLNNDVASLDFILGDNVRYNFEYYIDKGFYWSIGIKSRFNQFNRNVSATALIRDVEPGVNKIDTELKDFTNQFYVQTQFVPDLVLSIGGEQKYLNIESETVTNDSGSNRRTFENTNYFSVYGKLNFDSYDNKYFPKEGFYLDTDFHFYLLSTAYQSDFKQFSIGKADVGFAFKIFDRLSVNIFNEGGFTIGENEGPYLNFALGGYGGNLINNIKSFYGYDWLSLNGDSFVKGSVKVDYEFAKKHHFSVAANYANIEDNIFDFGEWFTLPDYSGYALGYGWETVLGPIELHYTWSPELGGNNWYFNIGFWF
ncbi:patatin-like phospholipase family protein [Formosa sp. S-31]|uniref:patatin-like phospholipase family protein n=1 Tax=Formosa sp. S-31 TaxID=2790949 RepID=UPI003EC1332D